MTPFIRKELRLLAIPAGVLLAAAVVGPWVAGGVATILRQRSSGMDLLLMGAFLLGTPLVAAASFGAEFDDRTMTLLLTQPVTRARLWVGKWCCVVAVLVVLAGVELVCVKGTALPPSVIASGMVFLGMVVCSAPLWTLLARSTIGGVFLTLMAISWLELACNYVSYREITPMIFGRTAALQGVRAAYSLVTLWLGWRVFARFQAVEAGSFGGSSADWMAMRWSFLRPHRTDAIGNLVRKELMLQRPTFLVATAFVASWFVALLLVQSATFADIVSVVLLAGYVPFAIMLAGIMPLSEDTAGIRAWHLTLPVSARTQWAIKLVVSLVVGLGLALALPALLTAVGNFAPKAHAAAGDFFRPAFVVLVTGGIVLAFWVSALLQDTAKAAAGVAVALFAFVWIRWLAGSLGEMAAHAGWLVTFVAALNVPRSLRAGLFSMDIAVAVFIPAGITALWQSLAAFRQVRVSPATTIRVAFTLLAVAFATQFVTAFVLAAMRGVPRILAD